jgi:hypothetical protein
MNCILKLLIDLGSSISCNEETLNIIHNMVSSLESVKFAVETLCRRDATLLSTDKFFSQKFKMAPVFKMEIFFLYLFQRAFIFVRKFKMVKFLQFLKKKLQKQLKKLLPKN